jgi:hypothetical protein
LIPGRRLDRVPNPRAAIMMLKAAIVMLTAAIAMLTAAIAMLR